MLHGKLLIINGPFSTAVFGPIAIFWTSPISGLGEQPQGGNPFATSERGRLSILKTSDGCQIPTRILYNVSNAMS